MYTVDTGQWRVLIQLFALEMSGERRAETSLTLQILHFCILEASWLRMKDPRLLRSASASSLVMRIFGTYSLRFWCPFPRQKSLYFLICLYHWHLQTRSHDERE